MKQGSQPKPEITAELPDETTRPIRRILEVQKHYAEALELALGISGYYYIYGHDYLDENNIALLPGDRQLNSNQYISWDFHGAEVDVIDKSSELSLRIEYGPNGCLNCFTEASMSHILDNKQIAKEFSNVKSFIENSNECGYWGTDELYEALREKRTIDYLAPSLQELTKTYSKTDKNGYITTSIPEELLPDDSLLMCFFWKHVIV